jgi:hypothetical protein
LTSSGKQCTRSISTTPAPLGSHRGGSTDEEEEVEEDEEGSNEPVYCHQHTKTSLVQTGCFVRSNVAEIGTETKGTGEKVKRSREVWINYNGKLRSFTDSLKAFLLGTARELL